MTTRKQRLMEVYGHLRHHYPIHSKKDLAAAIHLTQPAIYSAFGGNEKYLTDNFFRKICAAFPEAFSIEYLLTGTGSLLLHPDSHFVMSEEPTTPSILKEQQEPTCPVTPKPSWVDDLLALLSQQVKENEDLNRELRQSLTEVNGLRADLQKILHTLQK